jgi:tetratricopeptide (TPR) repeat protein
MEGCEANWFRLPRSGRNSRVVLVLPSLILFLGISFSQERSQHYGYALPLRPETTQPVTTLNELRVPNAARSAAEKAREAVLKGKLSEAHKQVDRALRIYPNYAVALTIKGILDATDGRFDLAEQNLQAAINEDPLYGPAYVPLAAIHNDKGQCEDALPLLNRAMQLMPANWLVYLEQAFTETCKGSYQVALNYLQRAAALQPRSTLPNALARMHLLKGYALLRTGNPIEAIPEFEATIKAEPNGAYAGASRQQLAQISDH